MFNVFFFRSTTKTTFQYQCIFIRKEFSHQCFKKIAGFSKIVCLKLRHVHIVIAHKYAMISRIVSWRQFFPVANNEVVRSRNQRNRASWSRLLQQKSQREQEFLPFSGATTLESGISHSPMNRFIIIGLADRYARVIMPDIFATLLQLV